MTAAVKMVDVSKTFIGGVRAVDDVSLELESGRLYGLVGPNGAGKSTLTNLITGYLVPDKGEIYVNGFPVTDYHQTMVHCGVVKVEQHPNLASMLSPAEHLDILLSHFIVRGKLKSRAEALLHELGLSINLEAPIESIPISQQRIFEIVKALIQCELISHRGIKPVLILDEATAFLTKSVKTNIKNKLKNLISQGYTIIIISHELPEVIDISDEILVMTGGKISARFSSSGLDMIELVRSMFETEQALEPLKTIRNIENNSRSLVLENVSVRDDRGNLVVNGLNLEVLNGEIHGVAVIPGTGEKELAEAIYGLRRIESGKIIIFDKELKGSKPYEIKRMGVSLLSDDRIRDGLIYDASVEDNLTIGREKDYSIMRGKIVVPRLRQELAKKLVEEFSISLSSLKSPINVLSGGNMQRVYLARVLGRNTRLLIALHPTVGLDPMGAKLFYQKVYERRKEGLSSLIFSPDIKELLTYCDKVSVMRDGGIIGTFVSKEASVEEVGLLLSGVA